MEYDNLYKDHDDYFGSEADPLLLGHWEELDPSKPVLDLGAGQGRNTFFLAKQGFEVVALDTSVRAMKKVKKQAHAAQWPVQVKACSFADYTPTKPDFSGVLVFGLLQVLSWDAIRYLIDRIHEWTQKDSLVIITAFSVDDASFARWSKECKPIGKNSFIDMHDNIRTYLEPNQILDLFSDFDVVHHWEGLGPEHCHADESPERHARVEGVFRRR